MRVFLDNDYGACYFALKKIKNKFVVFKIYNNIWDFSLTAEKILFIDEKDECLLRDFIKNKVELTKDSDEYKKVCKLLEKEGKEESDTLDIIL